MTIMTKKERLEKLYKEISLWEKDGQNLDWTKVKGYNTDGTIDIEDWTKTQDPKWLEYETMFAQENFHWFFDQLKGGSTAYDYHSLYTYLLKRLTDHLTEDVYFSVKDENTERLLDDIIEAHEKAVLKLDIAFEDYIAQVEKPENITKSNDKIQEMFDILKKKNGMI